MFLRAPLNIQNETESKQNNTNSPKNEQLQSSLWQHIRRITAALTVPTLKCKKWVTPRALWLKNWTRALL